MGATESAHHDLEEGVLEKTGPSSGQIPPSSVSGPMNFVPRSMSSSNLNRHLIFGKRKALRKQSAGTHSLRNLDLSASAPANTKGAMHPNATAVITQREREDSTDSYHEKPQKPSPNFLDGLYEPDMSLVRMGIFFSRKIKDSMYMVHTLNRY